MLADTQKIVPREAFGLEDAWDDVILPWVLKRNENSFNSGICSIVVPNECLANAIKLRLLQNNTSVFDLNFWTPKELRIELRRALGLNQTLPMREDLHIIMASIIEKQDQTLITRAIKKNPELLVRVCGLLQGSENNFKFIEDVQLRQIALEYQKNLSSLNIHPVHQMDYLLLQQAKINSPVFKNVLLLGFSAKNWNSMQLLQSCIASTNNPTICFFSTNSDDMISQLWTGTWEQALGSSFISCTKLSSKNLSYQLLSNAFEFPQLISNFTQENKFPDFLMTQTLAQESQVILAKILEYLASKNCERLGVVFPNQVSPLAREVARKLENLEISHCDYLGHIGPQDKLQSLFIAWIKWQESDQLQYFIQLLELAYLEKKITYEELKETKDICLQAFRELLVDDFNVIQSRLKNVNTFLKLPIRASFADFISLTAQVINKIGWSKGAELLEARFAIFKDKFLEEISKEIFLRWLHSVIKTLSRVHSGFGKHPFSKVSLISKDHLYGLQWSHLIVTEMNEVSWSSDNEEIPFLKEDVIRKVNQQNIHTGKFGDGHTYISADASYLTTSSDYRAQEQIAFAKLIASTTECLAFSVHTRNSKMSSRDMGVSSYFEKLYWLCEGEILNHESIFKLQNQTKKYLKFYSISSFKKNHADIQEVIHAYKSRRNPGLPFDEFSYGFKDVPKEGLMLSCKSWEDVLRDPSSAWIKHILHIDKTIDVSEDDLSLLALGIWTHDWLALKAESSQVFEKPTYEKWKEEINISAKKLYSRVRDSYGLANRTIPVWWIDFYNQAQQLALNFAKIITQENSISYLLSEYSLPKNLIIKIADVLKLPVTGRIDLIGINQNKFEPSETLTPWIIDFKTARSKKLTLSKLLYGEGLQLVLYTLALQQLGHRHCQASILNITGKLANELNPEVLTSLDPLLVALNRIQTSGVFGDNRISKNSEFYSSSVPIAVIPIAEDILEKKWALTHKEIVFR